MRSLGIVVMVLLFVCPAGSGQDLSLVGRLRDETLFENRVQIAFGSGRSAGRMILVDSRTATEQIRTDIGLSTPWITAGPVALSGLLRQAHNPLGHDAGSSIFREDATLVLDGSFSGGSRHGLQLSPWPQALGLFFFTQGETRQAGMTAVCEVEPWRVEVVTVVSRPPSEEPGDTWYSDFAPFPGGPLVVTGGGLAVLSDRFRGAVRGFVSDGGQVDPGSVGIVTVGCDLPRIEVELLGGLAAPGYWTPRGTRSDYRSRLSGVVSIGVGEHWTVEGAYRHRLRHEPQVLRAGPQREGDERYQGDLALKMGAVNGATLDTRIEVTLDRVFHSDGDITSEPRWRFEAIASQTPLELSLAVLTPDRVSLGLVATGIWFSTRLMWDQHINGPSDFEAAIGLGRHNLELEIEVETDLVRRPVLTLRWETSDGHKPRA